MGEWKKDAPSGAMTEFKKQYDNNELVRDRTISVTVADGLYNGRAEVTINDVKFYAEYANGIVTIQDETDPNGNPNKVYMYNEDKTSWYYFKDESSYARLFGMPGYGAQ